LRSGGALHTKGFPEMRSRTGWPSAPPVNHGVKRLAHADKYGRRSMPIPASLAHLKRTAPIHYTTVPQEVSQSRKTKKAATSIDHIQTIPYSPGVRKIGI